MFGVMNDCCRSVGRRGIGNRGAAHFEMIISFVFFVGFVFFLFVVLKPTDVSTVSGSVISGFYDSFREDVSTNLSRVFLKANYTGGRGCFVVALPGEIFRYAVLDGDSHVEKLNGDEVGSGLESSELSVGSSEDYFRVMISPEFDDAGLSGCDVLNDYDLGGVVERRVVSYGALEEMRERYYGDYDSLKEDLRIPAIFDFAIVNEDLPDVLMKPSSGILGSREVIAEDFLMEVLYSDGSVVNEKFTLKVW